MTTEDPQVETQLKALMATQEAYQQRNKPVPVEDKTKTAKAE